MKLYIDDTRPAPEGWMLAKDYDEAIDLLGTGEITEVSFDYHLGEFQETGLDIARWYVPKVKDGTLPVPEAVHVHSTHPFKNKIESALRHIDQLIHRKAFKKKAQFLLTQNDLSPAVAQYCEESISAIENDTMIPHRVIRTIMRVYKEKTEE